MCRQGILRVYRLQRLPAKVGGQAVRSRWGARATWTTPRVAACSSPAKSIVQRLRLRREAPEALGAAHDPVEGGRTGVVTGLLCLDLCTWVGRLYGDSFRVEWRRTWRDARARSRSAKAKQVERSARAPAESLQAPSSSRRYSTPAWVTPAWQRGRRPNRRMRRNLRHVHRTAPSLVQGNAAVGSAVSAWPAIIRNARSPRSRATAGSTDGR